MLARPADGSPTPPVAGVAAPAPAAERARESPPAVQGGPDGRLRASRAAPIGGQAVLEGVMMRGISNWAVAVRKPLAGLGEAAAGAGAGEAESAGAGEIAAGAGAGEAAGEIAVSTFPLVSALRRHRILRLPIIRGVVALGGSLVIGLRALEVSANAQLPPEEEQEISRGMWAGTVVIALALAVALFFLLPVGLTSLVKDQLGSPVLFWLVEGILRTGIFLAYLYALSRVRDLRRVFEYHGAEHKTISCFEAGLPLTPGN